MSYRRNKKTHKCNVNNENRIVEEESKENKDDKKSSLHSSESSSVFGSDNDSFQTQSNKSSTSNN